MEAPPPAPPVAGQPPTGRARSIAERLRAALHPDRLEVIDESELHRGHAGWREGGDTHFRVRIAAAAFDGLSRVARHRLVTDALHEEFARGLHALSIEATSPTDAGGAEGSR